MRVLIADDEKPTAKALKLFLEKSGFTADTVHTGTDAWEAVQTGGYDAVVLDIMMPGMDGISVLKRMRAAGMRTPVMMLTAKAEIEDRVAGLEAGADDYLPKPFATAEFIARVKALARRNDTFNDSMLTLGNVTLDCNRMTLRAGGNEAQLTNKEFQLMELFLRRPGIVFSTQTLMDTVWGMDSESNVEVVCKHVSLLRKELERIGADIVIGTVRGAGYRLEAEKC